MVAEQESKKTCRCEHTTTLFWCGPGRNIPVLHFRPDVCLFKNNDCTCNKMASRGVGLTYKFVKTECRLLRQLLEGHGFKEIHQTSNDFNLMWSGCHVKPYTLRGLTELQKVNHFPRSYEITRKDRLYKNYMRMRQTMGAKHFDFLPVTFVLPSELNEFYSCYQRERGLWIAKPVASSRGRGINIIGHPNQINLEEQSVVCRYISNPLLVDGFKFDLRIYVLVTSFDPLRVYIFNEGLARFSTVRYDSSPLNLDNMFMHLTNYSINKKSAGYVKCSDPDIEDYGNKWSMSALLRYLKNEGFDTAMMMMRIEDLIIKTIISAEVPVANACRMFLPHRENCFELFGFDVIFDENCKPWLLEVNLSPSLACESPLDLKIKSNLVSQMLTLSGVVALDPYSKRDFTARRKSNAKQASYSMSADGSNAAPLSNEDLRLVRQTKEEFVRRGSFSRVFPSEESWDTYGHFLENKTHFNFMLHSQLYPNRTKERRRPSSAIISMNKFREMNGTHKSMVGMSPVTSYTGIKERYSRYEKSLQPLGTVEDYPPESLVDAITPDFSVVDDPTTDEDTKADDLSSVTSSPSLSDDDGVSRNVGTQTRNRHLPSSCSGSSTASSSLPSTPDIPTDDRPLAEVLTGIRRGSLRPLCDPGPDSPFLPDTPSPYSAFNPKTQSFEICLSRRERVTEYSRYVQRLNRYTDSGTLLHPQQTPTPTKLTTPRLLPARPTRYQIPVTRERPGSLTLRSTPPRHTIPPSQQQLRPNKPAQPAQPKKPPVIEVIKQSQLTFSSKDDPPPRTPMTYEQFLEEQKKRGRPSSVRSLTSSFADTPLLSRKDGPKKKRKGRKAGDDEAPKPPIKGRKRKGKGAVKDQVTTDEVKMKLRKEELRREELNKEEIRQHRGELKQKEEMKLQKEEKLPREDAKRKEEVRLQKQEVQHREETQLQKSVNVSVFTRDNLVTMSSGEVKVSASRESTTILVTVPRGDEKPIKKLEISLDTPTPPPPSLAMAERVETAGDQISFVELVGSTLDTIDSRPVSRVETIGSSIGLDQSRSGSRLELAGSRTEVVGSEKAASPSQAEKLLSRSPNRAEKVSCQASKGPRRRKGASTVETVGSSKLGGRLTSLSRTSSARHTSSNVTNSTVKTRSSSGGGRIKKPPPPPPPPPPRTSPKNSPYSLNTNLTSKTCGRSAKEPPSRPSSRDRARAAREMRRRIQRYSSSLQLPRKMTMSMPSVATPGPSGGGVGRLRRLSLFNSDMMLNRTRMLLSVN